MPHDLLEVEELVIKLVLFFRYAERNFIDSAIITAFNGEESGTQEFILEYLLKIAGLLDFSDEVGRYLIHIFHDHFHFVYRTLIVCVI